VLRSTEIERILARSLARILARITETLRQLLPILRREAVIARILSVGRELGMTGSRQPEQMRTAIGDGRSMNHFACK
jgi:hypothetical protein